MFADSELCVRVALLPASSLSVPLFKARTLAPMLIPSVSVSPASIVYWNTRAVLPLPDVYVALRSVLPTTRVIFGKPVTSTFSLKVDVNEITSPVFSRLF